MAYNFCHHLLLPKIRCNALTVDGFEVSNLTSANFSQRSKGFLVESFIKPPVTITLQFPVNVNVHKVVVATTVGSQRSTGLELYAHSIKRRTTWLFDDSVQSSLSTGNKDAIAEDKSRVYACIGRDLDEHAQYFSFINERFVQRTDSNYSKFDGKMCGYDLQNAKVSHAILRAKHNNHLDSMSTLVLRITRTMHGSTCAIKWLEVWGNPAWNTPRSWLEKLMQVKNNIINPKQDIPFVTSTEVKDTSEQTSEEDDCSDLPEEFLDPLTQDMLTMPILLPCGKTINQSSLDRHIEAQSKWGQPPTDPFTGQTFSNSSKPVPNSALKARLDQFLFQNPRLARKHDVRVGKKNLCQNSAVSSVLISDKIAKMNTSKRKIDASIDDQPLCKRQHVETTSKFILDPKLNLHNTYPVVGPISHGYIPHKHSSTLSSNSMGSLDFSTCDLDTSLKNTLAGLPSFLGKPNTKIMDESCCVMCSKQSNKCSQLYRLPCSHLVCRPCLLGKEIIDIPQDNRCNRTVFCTSCGQHVDKSKAVKVHL